MCRLEWTRAIFGCATGESTILQRFMPSIKKFFGCALAAETNKVCDCIKNANRRKLSSRQEIFLSVRDKSKINIPWLRLSIVKRREWKHNFRTFPLIKKNSIKNSLRLSFLVIVTVRRPWMELETFLGTRNFHFSFYHSIKRPFLELNQFRCRFFAVTESDINNSRLLSFRARSRLVTESRLFPSTSGSKKAVIALTK